MQKYLVQGYQADITAFLNYAFSLHKRDFQTPPETPDSHVLPNKLLDRYLDFCRIHQGIQVTVLKERRHELHRLRTFLGGRNVRKITDVALDDVDAFLLHRSKSMGTGLRTTISIMRSFFRYLHLNGDIPTDLAQQVTSPCRFSRDLRPKYLPWNKIQQWLAGIDRSRAGGKRDYAILVLLAYHGLRAREAARLKINDVEWDNRCVSAASKKKRLGRPLAFVAAGYDGASRLYVRATRMFVRGDFLNSNGADKAFG